LRRAALSSRPRLSGTTIPSPITSPLLPSSTWRVSLYFEPRFCTLPVRTPCALSRVATLATPLASGE